MRLCIFHTKQKKNNGSMMMTTTRTTKTTRQSSSLSSSSAHCYWGIPYTTVQAVCREISRQQQQQRKQDCRDLEIVYHERENINNSNNNEEEEWWWWKKICAVLLAAPTQGRSIRSVKLTGLSVMHQVILLQALRDAASATRLQRLSLRTPTPTTTQKCNDIWRLLVQEYGDTLQELHISSSSSSSSSQRQQQQQQKYDDDDMHSNNDIDEEWLHYMLSHMNALRVLKVDVPIRINILPQPPQQQSSSSSSNKPSKTNNSSSLSSLLQRLEESTHLEQIELHLVLVVLRRQQKQQQQYDDDNSNAGSSSSSFSLGQGLMIHTRNEPHNTTKSGLATESTTTVDRRNTAVCTPNTATESGNNNNDDAKNGNPHHSISYKDKSTHLCPCFTHHRMEHLQWILQCNHFRRCCLESLLIQQKRTRFWNDNETSGQSLLLNDSYSSSSLDYQAAAAHPLSSWSPSSQMAIIEAGMRIVQDWYRAAAAAAAPSPPPAAVT